MKYSIFCRIRFSRSWLVFSTVSALSFGCSGSESTGTPGSAGSSGGGNSSSNSGGNSNSGGSSSSGGSNSNSGGSSGGSNSSNSSSSGGSSSGGSSSSGGVATGGARVTGGSSSTGGVASTGGTSNVGGSTSTGGSRSTGGAAPTGGSKATGGAVPTGGVAPTGGASTVGGGTSNDRCDVGVYDSANPPKVLTLSGNLGAHDPAAILQTSNNTYYEFQTGLGAKTSTNLTTWSAAAAPFGTPAWLTTNVPGVSNLWAPDISYFNGQYHLYYAGSTFGSNRSCIGHATRASLNSGSWTDQGAVICSNVNTTDNWNAIDPNVVVDTSGTPWLDFGSFWSGIKIIQLDQNGARVGTGTPTAIAARPSNGGALEGPFIVRRCGYYYLFTSWDTCCKGADSTYNIRVVRSTSVTGPYVDKAGTAATSGGGTLIAQGDGTNWAGPGGQSVFFSGTKAYLIYHAYAVSNGAATLRIADLVWDSSGWPVAVGP